MLSRRAFFRRAAVAASALAIADDPERLLWTPGAKTISIPVARFTPGTLAALRVYEHQLRIQDLYNVTISAQIEALSRHGLPTPFWYPELNS